MCFKSTCRFPFATIWLLGINNKFQYYKRISAICFQTLILFVAFSEINKEQILYGATYLGFSLAILIALIK